MHVLQYIATQADDVDHAFRSVRDYLENQMGDEHNLSSWYDWFVTGGGRWASNNDPYNDEFVGDVVHQSSPKFQEYLDKANSFRTTELDNLLVKAREIDLQRVLENVTPNDFRGGMALYPITKIYDMTMGKWDYNSYFFDVINDSTNTVHLKNSLDNGADDWYLVPVDFHF